MSLQSTAQELIVADLTDSGHADADDHDHDHDHDHNHHMQLVPLEIVDDPHDMGSIEVSGPVDIEIIIEDLPGAPTGTMDPEPEMEVSENDSNADENDAKKSKKNEKWDWASHGPEGFITWIKDKVDDVPKHSGYDSAGLERAVSYFERLDNEISKAMRLDLDGELDANKIESVRSQIDDGLSRLHDRLDKVKKQSKNRRKKKSDFTIDPSFVKEAQKITGVQGIYITVPLLISRVARVCINGMVSAGHDIEDIYAKQVAKYKLNDREQAETMQLLADMGYPLRQDRGYLADEDVDVSDSNNMDWSANYKG
jgi:hypothetical protein